MTPCSDWKAWISERSRRGKSLHVQGTCTFPSAGYVVQLERWVPRTQASRPGGTFVRGPAVCARSDSPPVFGVDPRPNSFYALEVATAVNLFDRTSHGPERSPSNYYATWDDGPLLHDPTYVLPQSVWERLVGTNPDVESLFYRLWTSASATRWESRQTTTPDDDLAHAPAVQISEHPVSGLDSPEVAVLYRTVRKPLAPGDPASTRLTASYAEQKVGHYSTVVILPDGISVDVEVAN